MKLEYLENLSENGKYEQVVSDNLVRLYDFNEIEAELFVQTLRKLIEEKHPIDLTDRGYIQPVNCSLILGISQDVEIGIYKLEKGNNNFVCELTIDTWKEMIELALPFTQGSAGYQWLYEQGATEIDLLFSPGGTW